MIGGGPFTRAFEQFARSRRAGQPTPVVLVGDAAVRAWVDSLGERPVVRLACATAEEAASAYLSDPRVRREVVARVAARASAVRAAPPTSGTRTAFEEELWSDAARDALLAAGELDAHRLVGYVGGGAVDPAPLRAFVAAVQVLGEGAAAVLVERPEDALDGALRAAIGLAEAAPGAHVAVAARDASWQRWQGLPGREHAKALLRPCIVTDAVAPPAPGVDDRPAPNPPGPAPPVPVVHPERERAAREDEDARSAAERALFDALDAHPASRGRFALNRTLGVPFGNRPLEIDLACAALQLAVEVDGYFHFRDVEAYRRDRRKDLALQRQGYFVVRVLAEDVMARLDEVVGVVHRQMEFLGSRTKERAKR